MKKTEILDNITSESLRRMLPCYRPFRRLFSPGDVILKYESQVPDNILIMEKGSAKLSILSEGGDIYVLEHYNPGDIFGELFSMPLDNHEYTVTAETNCSVIYIDYHHIITPCEKLCAHHSQLISNLFLMTAQKSQELSLHISLLHQPGTRAKLLAYLNYIRSNPEAVRNDGWFTIPLNLTELAEYLAVDRAAMMRTIKAMKEEGVIESNKQEFRVM